MVFSSIARSNATFRIFHRLTSQVIKIAISITIPTPITKREHAVDIQPLERFHYKIKFNSHMTCINTLHIYCPTICNRYPVLYIGEVLRFIHGLIHPLRIVGIHIGRKETTAETITQFKRNNLFILSIRIQCMTILRIYKRRIKHWSTAYITSINKYIMFFC